MDYHKISKILLYLTVAFTVILATKLLAQYSAEGSSSFMKKVDAIPNNFIIGAAVFLTVSAFATHVGLVISDRRAQNLQREIENPERQNQQQNQVQPDLQEIQEVVQNEQLQNQEARAVAALNLPIEDFQETDYIELSEIFVEGLHNCNSLGSSASSTSSPLVVETQNQEIKDENSQLPRSNSVEIHSAQNVENRGLKTTVITSV